MQGVLEGGWMVAAGLLKAPLRMVLGWEVVESAQRK